MDLYPDLYAPGCGGWGLGARQIQEWAAFVYIDLHRNSQARSRDGWGLANVAISRDSMAGARPNQYLTVATSTHCTVGPFQIRSPSLLSFSLLFSSAALPAHQVDLGMCGAKRPPRGPRRALSRPAQDPFFPTFAATLWTMRK